VTRLKNIGARSTLFGTAPRVPQCETRVCFNLAAAHALAMSGKAAKLRAVIDAWVHTCMHKECAFCCFASM